MFILKKEVLLILPLLFLVAGFALPAHAQVAQANCENAVFGCFEIIGGILGNDSVVSFANQDAPTVTLIQKIANFITGAIVAIGVIMVIVGGYFYITAGGDAARVSTAKRIIATALGGIALALIAVTILNTISPQFADDAVDPQCAGARLLVLRVFEIDDQLRQPGIPNERRDQLNDEKSGLQRELGRLYGFCPRVNVDNPFI